MVGRYFFLAGKLSEKRILQLAIASTINTELPHMGIVWFNFQPNSYDSASDYQKINREYA